MNREQIMDAMGYIDPALIEAAGREAPAGKRRRNGWSRGAVIAACLCLVLAGTAMAAELAGFHITGFFEDEPRVTGPDGTVELVSGYTASRGIRYFSVEDFSQEIIELDQGFTEPAARSFSSWEKMEEYVGLTVMDNPVLDGVPADGNIDVGLPGGRGEYVVYLSPGPGHAADGVTPMTGITSIRMDGSYSLRREDPDLWPWNGIGISVSATLELATENSVLDEVEHYFSDAENVTYEEYVTPNGLLVLISKAEAPVRMADDSIGAYADCYTANFTLNGVSFQISATDYKDFNGGNIPAGLVEEVLKEVLDGFVCEPAA